ncbi:MAG: helix-turn-helix domain-containing protein [Cyanobacteria bacterium J06560_2]
MSSESETLKAMMQVAEIPSYRALSVQAGVSRWQVQQLRSGHISTMRVATLVQIASALGVSLADLLSRFELSKADTLPSNTQSTRYPTACPSANPIGEAKKSVQSEVLQTIETWLVQWPTIAKRAQEKGAALPAAKVLPFVRPIEKLMADWGVVPIAAVDEQVSFDPQYHQLSEGMAHSGELVRVTHTGSLHHGKLLHRAKVKPLA